ncbi:uncharacterized protein LOC113511995 [Galleria mellonella]|uniref:Uncharacterized protein LOC113511995 n=1 Tax=Galleria mellonella TaxID=7137 RepID=A0A6J1WJX5_GALME|nr:uncharacterized protein LOC113511995 [Galleria mellonella]
MYHSGTLLISLMIFIQIKADSIDDPHGYNYNKFFAPSTANFNDIYTNTLLISEEETLTTIKDVDFHINRETPSPPPPLYILNSAYLNKMQFKTEEPTSTSSIMVKTIKEHSNNHFEAIPNKPKKNKYQRGVLDLLFPPARVRTFKNVFDTFRKLLSHTFR